MSKKVILDAYEQDLEDNLEKCIPSESESSLKQKIIKAANAHLSMKKSITLRTSVHDIEIIKIKASKLGIPYQTYLNMLIHKDASSF